MASLDRSGQPVVASDLALYWRPQPGLADPPSTWTRIGWEQLAYVRWEDSDGTLTLAVLPPTGPRRTVLLLSDGAAIGRLASERIAATHIVRARLNLPGYGVARVLGRRRPGTGEVVWLVALDQREAAGVDDAVAAALGDLAAQLGLPAWPETAGREWSGPE